MAKYKRVLLKLSGESLMGEKQYGIDEKRLAEYAAQIKEIHELVKNRKSILYWLKTVMFILLNRLITDVIS